MGSRSSSVVEYWPRGIGDDTGDYVNTESDPCGTAET